MSTKKTSPKKAAAKVKVAKKTNAKTKTKRTKKIMACPNKPLCGIVIIILGIAATVLISTLIIFASLGLGEKLDAQSNAERFAAEYSTVSKDNPFIYKTAAEAADIIEHGTGAVYLGFSSCEWCQAYAGYLDAAAKDANLSTIYYVDIKDDRENNTEAYQKLVSLLSSNLQYDEEGHRRIYVPDAVFVIDGRIIGNDLESSKDTAGETEPSAYWTEARAAALKNRLTNYMKQIVDSYGCGDACNK